MIYCRCLVQTFNQDIDIYGTAGNTSVNVICGFWTKALNLRVNFDSVQYFHIPWIYVHLPLFLHHFLFVFLYMFHSFFF